MTKEKIYNLVAAALKKKRVVQTKEIEHPNHMCEVDPSAFKRHGFFKVIDSKKKICVMVNEEQYEFDYETNVIYEIPKEKIKFAMCMHEGPRARRLFVNKDYTIMQGTTSPYRTFYEGLMKEPFRFCYPFDEPATIVTKKKDRLRFWVESK